MTLNALPDRPRRDNVLFYNEVTDWWKPHQTAVRSWWWPWGLESTPPMLHYANVHEIEAMAATHVRLPTTLTACWWKTTTRAVSVNNLVEVGWSLDSSILLYYAQLKTLFVEKWLMGSFAPVLLNTARILKDACTALRRFQSKTVQVVDFMAGGCVILHRWQGGILFELQCHVDRNGFYSLSHGCNCWFIGGDASMVSRVLLCKNTFVFLYTSRLNRGDDFFWLQHLDGC